MKLKFKTKYRIMLHKSYFDTGLGITNYFKYFIVLVGLASIELEWLKPGIAFLLAFLWGIACYLIGRWWYKYGWIYAQAEVGNQFNLFQKEVRKKLRNSVNRKT